MSSRRNFLKLGTMSLMGTWIGNSIVQAKENEMDIVSKKLSVSNNDVILFQGDSITDHGRKRENSEANNLDAMGRGYAMVAASSLLNTFADKNIKIYNKGISGHKVDQLYDRWQTDCLDLKPNILSILIGVNDYWHKRNGKYEGSHLSYRDNYRKLLDWTLKELPQVKLVIGEPFAVKGVKHVDDTWFPEFASYQEVARGIAKEYNAILIPYQSIFDKALEKANGSYWTTDGVHTSLAGINLMAESWLNNFK